MLPFTRRNNKCNFKMTTNKISLRFLVPDPTLVLLLLVAIVSLSLYGIFLAYMYKFYVEGILCDLYFLRFTLPLKLSSDKKLKTFLLFVSTVHTLHWFPWLFPGCHPSPDVSSTRSPKTTTPQGKDLLPYDLSQIVTRSIIIEYTRLPLPPTG